nr:glycosyltransferase [uncultured Clostridium sp.]
MKNINPKISVIVPVYNVEKWLNKCIDSILVQSYNNLEIILINDGSTDKSGDICDNYSKKDYRIRVFHNKNKGLSYSRNFGVKNSNGKYVMFVDSDDFISDSNIIEKFISILERDKCDFIYTSYCRFDDGNEDKITEVLPINLDTEDIKGKSGLEILAKLIENNNYHHAAYLKICRKNFLIDNKLFFKEEIYHEDAEWSPKLFYYANKVTIYKEPYYMRRMRENSIITTTNEANIKKKINDRLNIAFDLIEFFKGIEESRFKNIIINDFVRMYWGDLLLIINLKDKNNFKDCCNTVKNTKEILKYGSLKKYKVAYILVKIIGIKNFLILAKRQLA